MSKKIALLILVMFVLVGCGKKEVVETAVQAIPVKVESVLSGDLVEIYNTTGMIEAKNEVNVSAKVPGRVAKVNISLGDYIQEGQVLIELEKDDFINQNKQTKALLAQAEVGYKQSKDNYERMKKLYAEQLISQQQFDASQTQLEVAEAQLKQAQAGAEVSDSQLKNTEIKAPLSGFVSQARINQGEMVNPSVPLVSIVDLSKVYVTVNLSDSYIGQVRNGQQAKVYLQAYPEQSFRGTIVQISPAADMITKTFPVRIEINNTSQKFKAGMLAEVKLNFNERKNIIKIPIEAVIDEIGKKSVYVVEGDTARRKEVVLGISDSKMIEVIKGLSLNEQVVVMGQNNLDDGMKVVVK